MTPCTGAERRRTGGDRLAVGADGRARGAGRARSRDADLIVGTSAGSVVGAQIALGRDLNEQIERYRRPTTPRRCAERSRARSALPPAGAHGRS